MPRFTYTRLYNRKYNKLGYLFQTVVVVQRHGTSSGNAD